MITKLKFLSSMVALILCLTAVAFGQERTGNIEGTVTDATGAVVPGATVVVTSSSFTRTGTTDDSGFYRILQIPPGFYTVSTSSANFRSERKEQVEVVLGRTTLADVSLQAGGIQEEVVVSATDVAAIDPTGSRIQTNITERAIELLPKGVNFTTVLQVNPATRNEPLAGGFQIDGASGSENTFIIDGQEVTNFRTGALNINNNIPFQFVQEVEVKNSGFEAEYGGATGGVINVVTKRGENEFHGEGGLQLEPSELFSRPRPVLSADQATLRYIQPRRDEFTNYFPSVTVSGPVLKDRIWFFTSYNIQSLGLRRSFIFPDGTGVEYTSNDRRDYGFARIDGQVSDKLQLSSTYTYNPLRRRGIFPTFGAIDAAGTRSRAPNEFAQGQQGGRQPASNFSISGVYTPTPNLVISARGGRGYLNEAIPNYGIPNQTRILCRGTGNLNLPGVTPEGRCASGFQNIGGNRPTTKDISIRQTFDVDASYLTNFFGRHQFKGGYQLNRISNDVLSGNVGTGVIVLNFGRTFADASGRPRGNGPGEFGHGFLQQFGEFGKVSSKNEGIFFQDAWQPIDRLTLNLGVRFEKEDVPPFNNGPGIEFEYSDKIAPRIGGAFDVMENGKFKVFASYGRFFDRFKYELPRGSFGGNIFTNDYFVITNPNFNTFTFQNSTTGPNNFLQLNFRVPANATTISVPGLGTFNNLVDPDLEPVRQQEFTVGTEYGLSKDIVLGARYTRKRIDRTIEDVGIPDATGNETFFIANPGFGLVANSLIPGVPATPEAVRKYDAFEVRVDKRFTQNYYLNASYTYSRLRGNYGGLASSDEDGRQSPNVTRAFDLPFESFTPNGVRNDGRLATDRPHVFKFFGGYTYNWFGRNSNSTDIFGSFIGQSGTPLTTNVDILDVEVVFNGRGDLGRTEKFTQTDFGFTHRYRFGGEGRYAVVFEGNVLNLLNESNELDRNTLISTAIFGPAELTGRNNASRTEGIAAVFNGGTTNRINALLSNDPNSAFPRDARFNNTNLFQGPRQVRFGFKFEF